MSVRLALLRHGHTAWNRTGRLQGRIDEPLDEEARLHLASLTIPQPCAEFALLSSPLRRAAETAAILGRRAPEIAPVLTEMDWGAWEGQRGVDLLADPASGYRHIEHWGWEFRPPGGETPAQVWQRLQPWLCGLRRDSLAVTHVGVMRVLLARATRWDFAGEPPFKVKRDRLYIIEIAADDALRFDMEPVRLIKAFA